MESLAAVVDFLDRELRVADFEDASHNGLQVENSGRIGKICCGVDASMEFFEAAHVSGAGMVICHHGISWGDSLSRITDLNYRRVGFLIQHDIALYACHLPLDAHPKLGNNIRICRELRLRDLRPFGRYGQVDLGFAGRLPKPMRYAAFKKQVMQLTGGELRTMDFGRKTVSTVAVVSGGAAEEVAEAGQKGIDVYLSGEPKLSAYSLAQEYGVNAVFAGHYATETFGVRALAQLLAKRFDVKAEFLDMDVPY